MAPTGLILGGSTIAFSRPKNELKKVIFLVINSADAKASGM